jgi:hypothetical protein
VAVTTASAVALLAAAPAASSAATSSPLQGSQPVAGEITSVSGQGCMDNKGGNDPLNGSTNPVQLSNCNQAVNNASIGKQLWTVEPDSTIRMFFPFSSVRGTAGQQAKGPYKCLHANSDSTVELWNCDAQQAVRPPYEDWTFQQVTGSEYVLKVTAAFASAGGATVTKCLGEKGNGAPLAMVSCDPTDTSQQWDLPDNTPLHQDAPEVLDLQSAYDQGGGLFVMADNMKCALGTGENYIKGPNTPVQEYGGNCWWWSANAVYAMIDFLDHSGNSWKGTGSISSDLATTYSALCDNASGVNTCPTHPLAGQDHTNTNLFQNDWFDDTANWALAWLNAYQYTVSQGSPQNTYLYLAENLWYYITRYGWDKVSDGNAFTCGYPGGIVQSLVSNDPDKNLGVNSMYLRLSAWLYTVTQDTTYRDGQADNPGGPLHGGYVQEANWLFPAIPSPPDPPGSNKPPITLFNQQTFPGQPLIFYGAIDPKASPACSVPTNKAKELQHEGMMTGALAALYNAAQVSTGSSSLQLVYPPSEYLLVGQNLAGTMTTDTAASGLTSPPAVTAGGVLNESGDAPGTQAQPWGPNPSGSEAWLPGKGIFIRNLYCLGQAPVPPGTPPADTYGNFIGTSAQSIAQNAQNLDTEYQDNNLNYNEVGYWWQGNPYGAGVGVQDFATQLSGVEGLAAHLNGPTTTMC